MIGLEIKPRPLFAVVLVVVGGLLALAGCGGGGGATRQSRQAIPAGQTAVSGAGSFRGAEATPAKPAPPIKLSDSLGKQVDLA